MRKWLVPLIAIAAVCGVLFALLSGADSGRVTLILLGQANVSGQAHSLVLVSNGTSQLHTFTSFAQWSDDGKYWARDVSQTTPAGGLVQKSFSLKPGQAQQTEILIPSVGRKHRIALSYYPTLQHQGGFLNWRYWRMIARGSVGLRPPPPSKLTSVFLDLRTARSGFWK